MGSLSSLLGISGSLFGVGAVLDVGSVLLGISMVLGGLVGGDLGFIRVILDIFFTLFLLGFLRMP